MLTILGLRIGAEDALVACVAKVFCTTQRAGIFLLSHHAPVDWENVAEMSKFTQGHRPDDVRWAEAPPLPGKQISVYIA